MARPSHMAKPSSSPRNRKWAAIVAMALVAGALGCALIMGTLSAGGDRDESASPNEATDDITSTSNGTTAASGGADGVSAGDAGVSSIPDEVTAAPGGAAIVSGTSGDVTHVSDGVADGTDESETELPELEVVGSSKDDSSAKDKSDDNRPPSLADTDKIQQEGTNGTSLGDSGDDSPTELPEL